MREVEQFLELYSTGHTQRFHVKAADMLKPQDVAQHTYGVFWIVYHLTNGLPSRELMLGVMCHDAGERYTGDMPAHVKRAERLEEAMDALERKGLQDKCAFAPPALTRQEAAVLRCADRLEGALVCYREALMGNRLLSLMWQRFLEYAYKDYNDYQLHSMPGFSDERFQDLYNFLLNARNDLR